MKKGKKSAHFETALRAMYGDMWISALKTIYEIDSKMVDRWVSDESEIPDKVLRGVLTNMYTRSSTIANAADELAKTLAKYMPEYRIIYLPVNPPIRPDLNLNKRRWFDIDGKSYVVINDPSVRDMAGNLVKTLPVNPVIDADGDDVSLPEWVTTDLLDIAFSDYCAQVGDYD